jgi:hypothetical protein
VKWSSLLLATLAGTPAVYMFVRHKGPRARAVLAAVAVLFLISGVPSLLAAVGHPVAAEWMLLVIPAGFILCALFVWHDIVKGEHHKPVMSRKAIGGGSPAGPGAAQGGGKKSAHHMRPLLAAVGLVVFALMGVMNWSLIVSGAGNGFGQTVNTLTHHGAA